MNDLYRIDHGSNDWDQLGIIDADGESIGTLVPVTIDYEAIKAVTTRAVRLGNNMAAHNSGMGDDEIESDGEDFADDIMELLGGNE